MDVDIAPASGDHPVKVSSSLLRSDEMEYFSIKYGFIPDSVDHTAPLKLARSSDGYVIRAQGLGPEETHYFRGQGSDQAQDCVLIYNSSTCSFDLHPMHFTLRLSSTREKPKTASRIEGRSTIEENTLAMPPMQLTEGKMNGETNGAIKVSNSPKLGPTDPSRSAKQSRVIKPKKQQSRPTAAKPSRMDKLLDAQTSKDSWSSKAAQKSLPKMSLTRATEELQPASPMNEDEDDEDELLGALANDIEESLGNDSDEKTGKASSTIGPISLAAASIRGGGPISLRDYSTNGQSANEIDLSSSEEE